MEAVHKHEQRQAYNAETTTVNDVAGSLKSFTLDDDDGMSGTGTQPSTVKTFQTFASNYSSCSNVSFKKLLTGFRASSDLHKEMLAILSALTEIIRERGGNESSTEYFLLLISQIEAATEERDIIAGVALLSMGIKSVPAPVLRKRFSETAETLQQLLQRFIESSNQSVIRYVSHRIMHNTEDDLINVISISADWLHVRAVACPGLCHMDIQLHVSVLRCAARFYHPLEAENTQSGAACHRLHHTWQLLHAATDCR